MQGASGRAGTGTGVLLLALGELPRPSGTGLERGHLSEC